MYCGNCGAEVNAGAKFCPKCGTPVAQGHEVSASFAASEMPAGAAAEPPHKKRGVGKVAIAIIGIVVICAAVVAGIAFLGPVIGGPDYVSPFDFSNEAQVKRRVNEYFSGVKSFRFEPNMADMRQILGSDDETEFAVGYGTGEYVTGREAMQQIYDAFADAGVNYQQVFDAIVANYDVKIEKVDLDGDTAKCLVYGTVPDYSAVWEKLSEHEDFASLSPLERSAKIIEALSDPTVSTTTDEYWIILKKENGAWDINWLDSQMRPFWYFYNASDWIGKRLDIESPLL